MDREDLVPMEDLAVAEAVVAADASVIIVETQ